MIRTGRRSKLSALMLKRIPNSKVTTTDNEGAKRSEPRMDKKAIGIK
jgi:hypothetical protein